MVLEAFGKPLAMHERPMPEPAAGDAVVRVAACGVCGTDLKAYDGAVAAVRLPRVLGHEVAGHVVALGVGANGCSVGAHVCIYLYRGCGRCVYCRSDRENMCDEPGPRIGFERDGGFAEYVACAAENLLAIPDGVSSDAASILCDAAATAARALARAQIVADQDVAIIGVGGLGSFGVQLAALARAHVIAADIQPERLRVALELGAERAIDLRFDSLPRGLDAAIDFAGLATTASAGFDALASDGILVVTGYDPKASFPIHTQTLARSQRRIAGSRGSTRSDLRHVIDLVARGKLRPIIGDRYRLDEAEAALKRVRNGAGIGRAVIVG